MWVPFDKVSLVFGLLFIGIGSLIFGMTGRLDTGEFLTLMDSHPDVPPGLRLRAFFVVSGLCEIALGLWLITQWFDWRVLFE